MFKSTFFKIVERLKLVPLKQNTMYHNIIHVEIKVCCVIFKFAHGVSFLVCNELFAKRKSTISLVQHEFVVAMNITCRKLTT